MAQRGRKPGAATNSTNSTSTSQTATAEKPTPIGGVKSKTKKQDYSSKQTWGFELLGDQPVMLKIKGKDVTTYNDKTGRYEPIRYCTNERSIFISEQSKQAQLGSIVFEDGELYVDSTETTKLDFLFNSPDYGKLYRLIDRSRDAAEENAQSKRLFEAMDKVFNGNMDELRTIALVLGGSPEASDEEVRNFLNKEASRDPVKFLDKFDNELVKMQALVKRAENKGIISFENEDFVSWSDTGKRLHSIPVGVNHDLALARHLLSKTDSAISIQSQLEEQLGER